MPSKAVFSLRKHFPHSVSNMCACGLNKYQVHEPQGRAAEEDRWALRAVHRGQMNAGAESPDVLGTHLGKLNPHREFFSMAQGSEDAC